MDKVQQAADEFLARLKSGPEPDEGSLHELTAVLDDVTYGRCVAAAEEIMAFHACSTVSQAIAIALCGYAGTLR